ncbi:MAG: TetR/AcrR family transcriptional regulator [Prochloraceae cyanobacterium]|nr:TetR/AcrR family transcriptional regulator [Prochloraceae cyanobacterium]
MTLSEAIVIIRIIILIYWQTRSRMPRNKEFEPEVALEKAMGVFWRKGYFDTSVDELVQQVGVSRYGLYATFGNKHSLFLAALDRYRDTFVSQLLADLETPKASLEQIQGYFRTLIEISKTERGKFGCFMCNTATELASQDEQVSEKINNYLQRLTKAFHKALTNARSQNEIKSDIDVDDYAKYLTGVSLGLCVYARSRVNPETIEGYVRVVLATLT